MTTTMETALPCSEQNVASQSIIDLDQETIGELLPVLIRQQRKGNLASIQFQKKLTAFVLMDRGNLYVHWRGLRRAQQQ